MGRTFRGKDKKKFREQYDNWHEKRFRRSVKDDKENNKNTKDRNEDKDDDDRY